MRASGIEVRPLRQMTGTADFNEVFLTDVRVPRDNLVGKRGEGWIVANTTLKHERNMIGDAEGIRALFNTLVSLAKERPSNGRPAMEDPHIRQQLLEIEGYVAAQQYSGYRQMTLAARGQQPGLIGLMNKLHSTNLTLRIARLALDLLGDDGLCAPGTRENILSFEPHGSAGWVSHGIWALALHIGGGTANIQRNIIGERGLGLPRDLRPQSKETS